MKDGVMAAQRLPYVEDRFYKAGNRVLDFLGEQGWMDRPSYRFENALSFVFNAFGGARNRITNALNGVWLGHPVHPPLASLTSGALGTTVVLDVLSVVPARKTPNLPDASPFAESALGLGILASLASGATGVTDWQHTHDQDRRVGAVHGLLNVVATGLYIQSWRDRRCGRHLRGVALSVVGYGITTSSSFLGGALVFGSGIGTDQGGKVLQIEDWTPVVSAASLPEGKPTRVDVGGVDVVISRNGETVSAFGGYCPHLAAPMEDGWIDRGRIVCPWHGSQFCTETGEVVRGPSQAPLPCYQARLRDGIVELRGSTEHPVGSGKQQYLPAGVTQAQESMEKGVAQ
jgi:nitrite reductase/ring-hydroxylating ferredoxin subunit